VFGPPDRLRPTTREYDTIAMLTHRRDHTSGLHHVPRVNPGVQIYTPVEAA